MSTKTTKTNATKTNANKVNTNYTSLYNELLQCTSKYELVATMLKHGYYTSTTPTQTKNLNDLYIQFTDKSRLLIGKKSLKLYTNDEHAKQFNNLQFDKVNDGSYRVKRATVANTIENFTLIFNHFKQFAIAPTLKTE
jgi:hypothetical protein